MTRAERHFYRAYNFEYLNFRHVAKRWPDSPLFSEIFSGIELLIEDAFEAGVISFIERCRLLAELEDVASIKTLARVHSNEKPRSLPAPTPFAGLHLFGVLGEDRSGKGYSCASNPVRSMPAFIGAQGQWPLAGSSRLQMLQASAQLSAPSLLVLHSEHWQAGAFCADLRTVRSGGVI